MLKPVLGYEGFYEVDEFGNVFRLPGFWCKSRRPVKWQAHQSNHSQRVTLQKHGKRERVLVHRVVWTAFRGRIPDGLTINHIDGGRENNRLENLELANMSEQMQHAYATGLQQRAKGVARGKAAKLNDETIRVIRSSRSRGVPVSKLAAQFNVSTSCIYKAASKTRWSHV